MRSSAASSHGDGAENGSASPTRGRCLRCGGFLRYEVALAVCTRCGQEVEVGGDRRLQRRIDWALRSRWPTDREREC